MRARECFRESFPNYLLQKKTTHITRDHNINRANDFLSEHLTDFMQNYGLSPSVKFVIRKTNSSDKIFSNIQSTHLTITKHDTDLSDHSAIAMKLFTKSN